MFKKTKNKCKEAGVAHLKKFSVNVQKAETERESSREWALNTQIFQNKNYKKRYCIGSSQRMRNRSPKRTYLSKISTHSTINHNLHLSDQLMVMLKNFLWKKSRKSRFLPKLKLQEQVISKATNSFRVQFCLKVTLL